MTSESGAPHSNLKLKWFFTDPASRYELAEVIRLSNCSKDDIQNWVRRGMLTPDEVTPGRRVYSPTTVALLVAAAKLRENKVAAADAFMAALVITETTLDWFADGKPRKQGVLPSFGRDFRGRCVVLERVVAEENRFIADVLHPKDIAARIEEGLCMTVVRIHWLWLLLAERAQALKSRETKRV